MATIIIITRPRPRPNEHQLEEVRIELPDNPNDTIATILRRAADEQECGPTIPPVE